MKIEFSPDDLRPLVRQVAAEVIDRLRDGEAKINGRLAYPESEAAALLGLPRHSLRDLRLSGQVRASRLGKRVLYSRESLLELLRESET